MAAPAARLQRGERDLQVSGREGGRGGRRRGPAVLTARSGGPAGGQTPWPAMGDRRCCCCYCFLRCPRSRSGHPVPPLPSLRPSRPSARSYSAPPASHVDGAGPPRLLLGAGQGDTGAAPTGSRRLRAVRGAPLSGGRPYHPLPHPTFTTCSPDQHPEVPSVHPHRWDTETALVGIPKVMAAGRIGRKFSASQG